MIDRNCTRFGDDWATSGLIFVDCCVDSGVFRGSPMGKRFMNVISIEGVIQVGACLALNHSNLVYGIGTGG